MRVLAIWSLLLLTSCVGVVDLALTGQTAPARLARWGGCARRMTTRTTELDRVIAANILFYRQSRCWTQQRLATALGVSFSSSENTRAARTGFLPRDFSLSLMFLVFQCKRFVSRDA